MRVFFASDIAGNTGPSNANRDFCENWPACDELRTCSHTGKLLKAVEAVFNSLWCDVAITCSPSIVEEIAFYITKARGKAFVGFCHGYAPYENEINRLGLSEKQLNRFVNWLYKCDVVATNSELQKHFLISREPSLAGKVVTTMLGFERFPMAEKQVSNVEGEGRVRIVAVSGGTRPIKGNEIVAKAVSILQERGIAIKLKIYGRRYSKNLKLDSLISSCGVYMGQVSQSQLARELRETDVFVMNSRHESFGLSAIDALKAGCSVLLSNNCGVKEVFSTEPCDVISNNEDAEEVADKIEALFLEPNNKRLYETINFEMCDWTAVAKRFRAACSDVIEKK